jgi:hypothetical protein
VANLSLVFDVLARDSGASSTFKSVGDSAERAGKQTTGFGTQMAGAMKVAAGALLGAGLIEGFKSLYQAADESRKIGALTSQVIKSTGGAAQVSAKQVGDLAGAIAKKTGVDDEAIQSGQNLLLTFTNVKNVVGSGNDIFNQATKIMTDMSVALGTDASGSAIQLGKALNDPIKGVTALQRVGVSFTASQKEQIKTLVATGDTLGAQKIILQELNKEFGGAAEAAATPLGKLQQRIGDLAEQMGGYLLPIVDKSATFFMDKLLPAFSDIGSVLGATVIPTFKGIATVIGTVAEVFNALPGPLQAGALAFGAFLVLRGPLTSLFTSIGDAVTNTALKMASSVGAVGGFKAAAGGLLGMLGGPWGLAITGATVGLGFLVNWLGKSDESTKRATQATQGYAGALEQANGVINETVRQSAAKAAQDAGLLDVADKVGISLSTVTTAITTQGTALDSTRAKLAQYIAEHTIQLDANTVGLDKDGEAAQRALTALNLLSGQTNTTKSDQEQLGRATEAGTATQQTFAQQTEATRTALDEAKQAIDGYKLSLDILTGDSVSMMQVEAALNDAISAGKDAMDKLGGSVLDASGQLNLQSENGRKAADVLLDVRNSGNELISTMIQQGATTDEVQAKDAQLRQSFLNTAAQMGITGQNAQNLADKILGIPKERSTAITADTGPANQALNDLADKLAKMGAVATVQFNTANARDGFAARRATGGPVFGAGTATSDSIPALLSNGEHVITAREVKAAGGHSAVQAWRKSLVQGFADGGAVGYTIPVGLAKSTLDALEQKLMPVSVGPTAGAGVQRWLGVVLQALGMVHQPASLAQTVLRRMQQESGGNPMAINNWDINAKRGDPSRGLMQTIGSTFRAYAMPGYNSNIYDPLSNILASMRYAMARYGSLAAAYNKAGGYELGTDYVPQDGPAYLHKGEAVIPAGANAGWTGGNLSGLEITGTLEVGGDGLARIVDGRIVSALTAGANRGRYNG